MRVEPGPCYILHTRPYRETSLLIEIFSQHHGRFTLVVRGVRTGKKNNKSSLYQPYQKILLGWYGKGELGTVNSAESLQDGFSLTGSRLISGFYVNELIMRLLHKHEPHIELFSAYEQALSGLSQKMDEQIVLRLFEKRLLQCIGYGLVLDHDVNTTKKIIKDQIYYYQMDSGPTETPESNRDKLPKVHGSTLLALLDESLNDKLALTESRRLMRVILNSMLDNKPLASRDLYRSYVKYQ